MYNILFAGLTLAQQLAQLEDPTPIGSRVKSDGFRADVDPENAYDVTRDQTDDQDIEFEDTTPLNREHYVDVGYVHATISVWDVSDV
jgi:hypothetical protein